ncbi:MAG: Smr/MutS family protein [Mariprofundales bacterium]|nr:Smr/MutS family protein [Mariprofundales bacterium]
MSIEAEDDLLFATAIGNARPLVITPKVTAKAKRHHPAPLHTRSRAELPSLRTSSGEVLHHPSPWTLVSPGISRERLRKLGQSAVDITIDLHGMHREQALGELQRTLTDLLTHRGRIAEIIHGRGLHSEGTPILRQAVYDWLNHGKLHQHILAAIPKPNSGGGACLVLLRRQR